MYAFLRASPNPNLNPTPSQTGRDLPMAGSALGGGAAIDVPFYDVSLAPTPTPNPNPNLGPTPTPNPNPNLSPSHVYPKP